MKKTLTLLALVPVLTLAACNQQKGIGEKKARTVFDEINEGQNAPDFSWPEKYMLTNNSKVSMTMSGQTLSDSIQVSKMIVDIKNYIVYRETTLTSDGVSLVTKDWLYFDGNNCIQASQMDSEKQYMVTVQNELELENTKASIKSNYYDAAIKLPTFEEFCDSASLPELEKQGIKFDLIYHSTGAGNLSVDYIISGGSTQKDQGLDMTTKYSGTGISLIDGYLPRKSEVRVEGKVTAKASGLTMNMNSITETKVEMEYVNVPTIELPDLTSFELVG